MSDYDKMSVEELMAEVVKLAGELGCSKNVKSVHFPALESALRKAVIREAAVETAKKPKKRVKKKTVGGTGMSEDEYWHWQHDSYPN